jgi:uncharacterized protein (TIGR02145 family)
MNINICTVFFFTYFCVARNGNFIENHGSVCFQPGLKTSKFKRNGEKKFKTLTPIRCGLSYSFRSSLSTGLKPNDSIWPTLLLLKFFLLGPRIFKEKMVFSIKYFISAIGIIYLSNNIIIAQNNPANFIDQRDGKSYKTIGFEVNSETYQVWLAENLNVDKFRNGDPIPEAKTKKEWERAIQNKQPAWCYYDNNSKNSNTYGKLYNWYAVNDPRGLAPEGWKIPSPEEWSLLENFFGNSSLKLKSNYGWVSDGAGNGTNESGFSAVPGGARYINGDFGNIEREGLWWSTGEYNDLQAKGKWIMCYNNNVLVREYYKGMGLSVRCMYKIDIY